MALRGVKCPLVPVACDFGGIMTAALVFCMTWAAQNTCVGWVACPTGQESCQEAYWGSCKLTPLLSSQERLSPANSTPSPSLPLAATRTAGIRITLVSGGCPHPS